MESRLWGFNSWGFTERMMESPINPQPRWMETTAGSTQLLPPPIPPASSTAPSSALSAPVSMEDILARIARLEARLETSERCCAPAFTPSRGEADMSFGAQRDWRVPSWDPGSHPSPQSWRPPLPQQAPWDSPWLRANHEPSPAPRPSLADLHAPWESPWPRIASDCGSNRSDWEYSILCVPDPPPPHIDSVSCSIEPQREKRERGLAPFSLGLKVAEEKGDSKKLGAAENPSPNSVHATSGSGLGDGNANNAAQSSAADTNDNEFEKTLACTDALMVRGSKVAKEGDDFVVAFAKEGDELERASAHSHFGWAFLFQAQEGAVLLGLIPNIKSGVGSGGKGLKLREVSRRSIIFGIYALEEVYKDFLYLHLEDKFSLFGSVRRACVSRPSLPVPVCTSSSVSRVYHCIFSLFSFVLIEEFAPSSIIFPLSTPYSDFEALLSFKQSIHEDPQQSLSSWNQTTHFCTWKGVSCTKTPPNRVLSLILPSQGLVGTLSPHVANLSFLTTFILQNNSFHGPIPEGIGRLERLQVIEFSNNSFQGEIPTNLSQCSRLYYLNLIDNRLTGAVPPEIGSSLLDLEDLGLTSNMLSGTIPPSLGNLTKLLQLSLANCGLSGEIPESMSRLRRLKWFTLRQNSLSGHLPLSFNNLTEMVLFSVYSNRIQGTIPPDLLTLPKLRTLDLSTNHFTGSLPSSLSNSSRIEYLSVESNSLAGDMVDLTRLSGLEEFGVASNSLKGDIGTILSSLTNSTRLGALVLADNLFTGSLPDSVANLSTHLYLLNIKQNHLSGTIPSGVGGLVTLTALSLGDSGLEGPIPRSIGKLRKLQGISLLGNKLAGEVPSSFGNLSLLNHLRLGQNRLSGRIPRSLGNCSSLSSLDLSENYFNGSIPHEVMSLSSISLFIDLSRNVLSGDIPSQVGAMKSLGYMDLSHNRLSGTIPTSLSSCVMLNELCLEGNLLRGEIPESLSALKSLQYLDLSQNNISGRIPRFLVDFKLIYLNLSFNALQGEVPNHGVFQNQSAISLQGNHGLCGGIAFLNLPPCSSPHPSSNKLVKVLIPVAAGGICLALAACLCIIVYRRRTKQQEGESPREMLDLMRLSYADLLNATSGFVDSNLVGVGRFGCVYKGTIVNDDGGGERVVAVKVLRLDIRGAFKSLASECNALRGLRHRNLLKIVSVCDSIDFQGNDFKALVYEFMANGSLEDWLHRNSEERSRGVLSFAQRLDAAIDVASAVEYLHGGTDSIVIHGDLKPSNILLDRDMVAHVGDFGLAKIISSSSEGRSSSTAAIKGTIGYIAPEYGMNDVVSTQGDAYSYGILLLEMFTNTRPTSTDAFQGYANLQDFVSSTLPDRVTEVVDPLLHQQLNQDENKYWDCIVSILRIGVRCSMESPRDRMSMAEAVNDLKNIRSIFLADRKGRNVAPYQH